MEKMTFPHQFCVLFPPHICTSPSFRPFGFIINEMQHSSQIWSGGTENLRLRNLSHSLEILTYIVIICNVIREISFCHSVMFFHEVGIEEGN